MKTTNKLPVEWEKKEDVPRLGKWTGEKRREEGEREILELRGEHLTRILLLFLLFPFSLLFPFRVHLLCYYNVLGGFLFTGVRNAGGALGWFFGFSHAVLGVVLWIEEV